MHMQFPKAVSLQSQRLDREVFGNALMPLGKDRGLLPRFSDSRWVYHLSNGQFSIGEILISDISEITADSFALPIDIRSTEFFD